MRWIFLLLPWIELFTLIQLGSQIGALAALLYVFVTLVLGLTLLRAQGMEILGRLQASRDGQLIPASVMADDVAVGLAAVLLMVPGLVTDTLAIVVMFGPLRRRLFALMGGQAAAGPSQRTASRPGDAIDGEFRRLDDE
jgi:UPF0716 protein FxsA